MLLNTGGPAFAEDKGDTDTTAIITLKKIQKETSKMTHKQKQAYYEKIVNGIVKEAKKEKTVVGKIKVIHDRLASRITYDYATYEGTKGYNSENYYAFGAIVNGKGVCNAYAEVFRDALTRAGITNKLIIDRKMDHGWNLVKIDGKFYHIDLTWNDISDSEILQFFS